MLRFLKRKLLPSLTVLAVIPVLIIEAFQINVSFLPENIVLTFILVALAGISIAVLSIDNGPIISGLEQTNQRIGDVFLLSSGKIGAIRPAKEPSIWSGFEGMFFAVNPPLKLPTTSNQSYDAMVESHAARFASSKFNIGYYIFFTSGDDGRYFPEAVSEFKRFAKSIATVSPEIKDKLRVIIAEENAPGFSLFIGEKSVQTRTGEKSISYSVVYINEKPLMLSNGFPNWSFVSTDDDFNNTLRDYASAFLDSQKSMSYSEFIEPELQASSTE